MVPLKRRLRWLAVIAVLLWLLSLIPHSSPVPVHMNNACAIFKEYPRWYADLSKAEKRWKLPIPVALAIMHQESHFHALALTPHRRLLGIPIPWTHQTTARGYAQAIDSTWQRYQTRTHHFWVDRSSFASAADFMGWFSQTAHHRAGIRQSDAYDLYLAYHEGVGGYLEHKYNQKPWLKHVAWRVQHQANNYQVQLKHCQLELPSQSWWHYW